MKYVIKSVQVKGFTRTRKGKMERVKPHSREQAMQERRREKSRERLTHLPVSLLRQVLSGASLDPQAKEYHADVQAELNRRKVAGEPYEVKEHTKEEYKKYLDSLNSDEKELELEKWKLKLGLESLKDKDVGEPYSTKNLRHIEIDVKPGTRRTKEWKIKEALEENSNTINSPKYLNAKVKKDINGDLHDISTKYHTELPIDEIFGVLEKRGIVVLQEDNTKFSGFFLGENAQTYFPIAPVGSKNIPHLYVSGDNEFYVPFKNSALTMSWYRMPSGKYEITTYIG